MGFESFRVELRGPRVSRLRAVQAVERLPGARPDPDGSFIPGTACYTIKDGRHVIEVAVQPDPVGVSCRFTLSHPPSVDAVFLRLVGDLATQLDMDAWVCDDVAPSDDHGFPAWRVEEFERTAARVIACRRAEWVEQFGPTELAARTAVVFEKIVLPRCEPVAG